MVQETHQQKTKKPKEFKIGCFNIYVNDDSFTYSVSKKYNAFNDFMSWSDRFRYLTGGVDN